MTPIAETPVGGVAPPAELPAPVELPPDEEARLLGLARAAVAVASGAAAPATLDAAIDGGPPPDRRGAAFVTLTVAGELRGCMGSLNGETPVWAAVVDAAAAAVRLDPRFPPVSSDELPSLELSVSVLGPFVPLADPESFRLGTDGIMVARGGRRGLLLPEVAAMIGFDQRAMLDACCGKAGLQAGAWHDSRTQVFAFRTRRFGGPAVAP